MRNVEDGRAHVAARFARPPEPFSVEVRPDRRRVIVVPRGELDMATVGELAAEIEELVGRGFDAVALDLRETSFMDSSGVHLLLEQTARADARVTVIDASYPVRRVIDVTGARHLLPFKAAS
jgi:anti-anti-sigma factor